MKGLEFNLSTELGRENGETKLINEKSKFLQEKQQFPGRVVSKAREMTNLSTHGNREIKIWKRVWPTWWIFTIFAVDVVCN